MAPEIEALLKRAYPGEDARFFAPMKVGATPSVADEGAAAILAGVKTATSSAFWDWPDGRIPFAGALCVLLDGQDRPRALIETTRVQILAFKDADEDLGRAYGEGERTLDWFRREVGAYYRQAAARHGAVFTEDTPMIFEWFEVAKRL